jgi:hypothetical protein
MKDIPRRLVALAIAVLALAGAVTIQITSDDDGQGHKTRTVSIQTHVDGADIDTKADDVVVLNKDAQDQLDKIEATAKVVTNGVQTAPLPGADGQGLFAPELADPLKSPGDIPEPIPGPLAAQDWPGCRTQFVANKSYRTPGIKLGGIFEHYTVSADTPGWADNDALTARANSPIAGVSWHFQIGRADGNCTYNVPISMKAWHAAGANSATVGIEIHATGKEATYVTGAGRARLAQVVKEIERRTGIPNQVGQGHCAGSTFVITRPGLFRHYDGGLCSGGHIDTNPFPDPRPQTIADVKALSRTPITKRDRAACRQVAAYRKRERQRRAPGGKNPKRTKAGVTRFKRNYVLERNRGHRCVGGKVKQRA